jgi:hypothetical protein
MTEPDSPLFDERERKSSAANALEQRIGQVLAGEDPDVQGAALAGCLAIWLMGHRVIGDPDAAAVMRRELLELHIKAVRELIGLYAGIEE